MRMPDFAPQLIDALPRASTLQANTYDIDTGKNKRARLAPSGQRHQACCGTASNTLAKLRIGIVGAGSRGIECFANELLRHHSDSTEIAAVADPNAVRARAGLDWLGIKADVHEQAHDLASRKDVDAVIVTSPDYLHEEHAVAALDNGKHVFVDKPLAVTVSGCLNIIEASRRAGTLLYMGFNLRHDVVTRRMRELAAAGAFGEIFSIQAVEHYDGGRTYHSRWNRLKEFSGGLFIHKGSHDFDVINCLMGSVRPVRVSCFANVFCFTREGLPFAVRPGVAPGPNCQACAYQEACPDKYLLPTHDATPRGSMFNDETAREDGYYKDQCMYLSDKDTHDQGIAIVEYENGATASHSEYFATPLSNRHYLIEGTRGHGEADHGETYVKVYPRWSADVIEHKLHRATGGHGGADPVMIQEFLDCLCSGAQPSATPVDGLWSVALGVAAELSRAEKRVVEISEMLDYDSEML